MENQQKKIKVLRAGRLIDGAGGEVPADACVVVEGARIRAVGAAKDLRLPKGAEVIALPDCTLMPGLMDIHLHTSAYNILTFQNPRVAHFETTPQLQMLYTLLHAQMGFEMGFTTLRNHPWVTASRMGSWPDPGSWSAAMPSSPIPTSTFFIREWPSVSPV
jgi:imidazolonepropionase-like amidohydrolase